MNMDTFSGLFSLNFWLVAAGIYVAILTLRKSFGDLFKKPLMKRLLPMFPLVLGVVAMVTIPDMSEWDSMGGKTLHGLIAGFVAANFHKIGKQTILGKGVLEKVEGG